MTNTIQFDSILSKLISRYPQHTFNVLQWQKKEPLAKESLILGKILCDVLYIEKIKDFENLDYILNTLETHNKTQIVFFDTPSSILAFLETECAAAFLDHERIHLAIYEDLDSIIEKMRAEKIEVIATDEFKQKILEKSALCFANYLERLQGFLTFGNFFHNAPKIAQSFFANKMKGLFHNVPAIVIGAGPSLDSSIELLKKFKEKALIIAGGSTIVALCKNGIIPDFCMAVDPNFEEYKRLKQSPSSSAAFLYSTRLCPLVLHTIDGPLGYMKTGAGGAVEVWLEEELEIHDNWIGQNLTQEAMSVTCLCIAWAEYLGCNPILLNAIDLATSHGLEYAQGVTIESDSHRKDRSQNNPFEKTVFKKNQSGHVVQTKPKWILESKAISDYAKKNSQIEFINTNSDTLGFDGIAFEALDRFLERFPKQPISEKISQAINEHKFPNFLDKIQEKLQLLKTSLDVVIEHLEVLSGKKKGSIALAEVEMQEELAYKLLFYDIEWLLERKDSTEFYLRFYEIALKYKQSI